MTDELGQPVLAGGDGLVYTVPAETYEPDYNEPDYNDPYDDGDPYDDDEYWSQFTQPFDDGGNARDWTETFQGDAGDTFRGIVREEMARAGLGWLDQVTEENAYQIGQEVGAMERAENAEAL